MGQLETLVGGTVFREPIIMKNVSQDMYKVGLNRFVLVDMLLVTSTRQLI